MHVLEYSSTAINTDMGSQFRLSPTLSHHIRSNSFIHETSIVLTAKHSVIITLSRVQALF